MVIEMKITEEQKENNKNKNHTTKQQERKEQPSAGRIFNTLADR